MRLGGFTTMAARALVSVAGVDLPTPSTYVGVDSTVVDAARNVSAVVVGAVVRDSVAKVEMTWNYLTAAQWSQILRLFNSAYGGSFYNDVTFFNQTANTWTTRKMYVNDRTTGGAHMLDPDTGAIVGYTNAKLSLIEV